MMELTASTCNTKVSKRLMRRAISAPKTKTYGGRLWGVKGNWMRVCGTRPHVNFFDGLKKETARNRKKVCKK